LGWRSVARLLPVARTFVSLPAGARRVPLGRFIVLTGVGSALWAIGFVLAGVLAGSAWSAVSSAFGRAVLATALAAALIALARGMRLR
jgi:membrane protein DedA with SNARE-associated domain